MRRRSLVSVIVATLVAGTVAVVAQVATSKSPAEAAASESYNWKNVRIDGGGFVDGIIFNPTEQNLIYARTDIGGAYRWNQATSSWTPLLDWVGWNNWGWLGVLSLATDPVQTNKVYAATGMYLNSWDPNNGAILRSTDKGATWQSTTLPFKVGGNMPGRASGERLAVDPNRNSTVYFGAEAGNGLWRSTDSGVTWAKVTNFPNAGNYVQDPADTNQYLTFNQGVVWVAFDKSTGTAGNTTQGIYVGVADLQNTVYRSLNGGTTWERLAGQPTGFFAHQGDVVGGNLYITTSDKGGPYDGGNGQVWKYQISTGTWTNISPPVIDGSATRWYGYAGLSVDRQNPNTIMVTGYSSWYPDTIIHRSTDGGVTWRQFYDYAWPNRTNKYTLDISANPWLNFNDQKSLPEQVPKLGWMTEALEIDPFNSNRVMYGTGATLFGTTNITALDTGGTVNVVPMAKGIEETAVQDLVSPPTGAANLFSGLFDVSGFRHTNVDAVPAAMYNQPFMGATTSIDFAETNPMWMVRVGKTDRTGATTIGFSTDSGGNWFQGSVPTGALGGTVAMNANNSRIVWAPENGGVWFSTSVGGSFSSSTGIPSPSGNVARVRSDRVNINKFYGFQGGTFYVSTNGGSSFTAAATGLGTTARFKAVPGIEGDIWLASDTGIYHSTNSGTSFTKVAVSSSGVGIGFGKAATGQTYPAIYTMATIDNVRGVYRSNDAGATWIRINDDAHQYGNAGDSITGDPRIYGRVYLGTNGRGIVYGDPGTVVVDTTPPTTPGTPTASAVTATTANLAWTASTDAGGSGLAGYNVYRRVGTTDTLFVQTTTNSAALTGLTGSTAYTFVVRARDGAGNLSATSGAVSFTTSPPPVDTTVPTTPGTPTASAVTATTANLAWTASTDAGGSGLAGYNVYRRVGTTDTLFVQTTTNSVALTGLTASTAYSFVVRARDGAGNLSATSGAVSFTTLPTGGGGGCTATYTKTNEWNTGFGGSVTVTNNGTTATTSWTVTLTFPNGQVITQLWGGRFTQSGAVATVTPETWNPVIPAGGNTSFGFNASWTGTNNNPTTTCTRTP